MLRHATPSAEADAVLTALENGHPVRAACRMARYAKRSVYRRRTKDPDFAARWAKALQMAGDLLEEEADRRGRDGIDVPVFHRGQVCGTKVRYANGLLLARLKAIKPAQYREGVATAAPASPQPLAVQIRDVALEDVLRRALRGETIDRTTLPERIQRLIVPPDSEAGR